VEAVSKEIRPGCVASFQLQTGLGRGDAGSAAAMSPDQIGIVAEVRAAKLDTATINGLFAGIRQAVTAEHGLTVARIALVKARTIPKTVSGLAGGLVGAARFGAGWLGLRVLVLCVVVQRGAGVLPTWRIVGMAP
jgi:O-succinylbenzoate synthase